jgi:hypothetical protein
LFILNIYFKNDAFDLEKDNTVTSFPINCGSDLFAIKIHKWTSNDGQGAYAKAADFDECIYIAKWTSDTESKMKQAQEKMHSSSCGFALQHPKMVSWLKANKIEEYKGHNLIWDVLGVEDYRVMLSKVMPVINEANKAIEFVAIVNKMCAINRDKK